MIDETDLKIIELLQEDGRMANKDIANRVNMAPSAISERMRKLRERGIIKAFETRVDATRLSCGLVAFIFVRTSEMAGVWKSGHDLAAIPEVQEVYNIAGEDCYLIKVRTRNTETLTHVLREKIGRIAKVTSTQTTIVLESFKETCSVPLEYAREAMK